MTTKAPYFGVCYPACAPFGTTCGGGTCANSLLDNDGTNNFEACRTAGAGGVGAPCGAQWDCQGDMNCVGAAGFKCTPMCDATHACGDGGACMPLKGLANGGGLCE